MKIIKLISENVQKLKAIEIVPEGNVIKITGANEQGKSTVLNSIWYAIGGNKCIPDQPIRLGETKASITVDLGDMIVTRKFTPSGSTLEVKNPQGLKYPKPQDMLDKLIGKFSFDPLAFAKANKKDQVNTLLGIVDIQVDAEKLGSLAGVVVAEGGNPLDTLNNVYKAVYEGRTVANRDRDRIKANYESKAGAVETEAVSISELVTEKDKLHAENKMNDQKRSLLESKLKDVRKMQTSISDRTANIADLKEELAEKEREQVAANLAFTAFNTETDSFIVDVNALEDKDLTDVNTRISNADETNINAQKWDAFKDVKADYEKAQEDSDTYTSRLEAVKNYKNDLMLAAKFPIEGLDFKNGGVFYQGLPFDQASSAQSLTVSLSIAMAINPELRVIRVNDGSLLDKKHMAIIEQMAREQDFQVWIEEVEESGTVGIYIEEGEIKNVEVLTK